MTLVHRASTTWVSLVAKIRPVACDAFGTFTALNTNWQFFMMPFEEMRQAGWGKRAPFFDIQHISNLTFFYSQGIWDIWIDDIAFYKRSSQ